MYAVDQEVLTAALCMNFMVSSLEDMALGVPPGDGRPCGLDIIGAANN